MKITFAVLPVLLPFVLDAQLTPTAVNADAIVLVPYQVVAAGPHERVWQSVTVDAEGNTNANSYTELATGLNYQNTTTGKWEESREAFEITKDGRAVANHGQHQVILAGDIYTGGSVDRLMPDGQRLLSNPMGLSFPGRQRQKRTDCRGDQLCGRTCRAECRSLCQCVRHA